MTANKYVVFIFGAPDPILEESKDEIPMIVKLEYYNTTNEIHKYYKQPMIVRYLINSEFVIRCWGCHKLITDYAYPHNFTSRQQNPVIVLCCNHLCEQFISYYKKSIACICCGCEFIPHAANHLDSAQNPEICPICKYKSWSSQLKFKVDNYLSGHLQSHLIDIIYKFMEINTAINNNKLIVSQIDT